MKAAKWVLVGLVSLLAAGGLIITILYDNNEYDERLEMAWGFSCLLEGADKRHPLEKTILFDTGGDWRLTMVRPLWQLLLENPSHLTCDECFAVLEYYVDMLVASDGAVLAEVLKRLESCPECSPEHHEAISRLSTIGK